MIDYRLVKVSNNYCDFYFVEQMHEPYHVTCLDWDLSDDEEKDLIKKFENGDLLDHLYTAVWEDPEYAYRERFSRIDLGLY